MIAEPQKSRIISSTVLNIAPSKMFTYPTRLAEAWKASIMEINLPAYQLDRPAIEVGFCQSSTHNIGIKTRNIFKRLYKRIAAPINMAEEYIYDSRYETDGNMAHILTIVAPPLLLAKEMCGRVTVVLKANASTMARNAYKLLGFPVLCTNKEVEGKLILAPDGKQGLYEVLYSPLFGDLAFEGSNNQTPERVFISRKGTRCLINENEVEETLQKYGFEKFYFEDIPISEQWSVAKNAKFIVGLHGAALASLVFNRNAVKVVELFHPGYVVNMYRHITNAVGGTWCGVTGQIPESAIRELDFKQNARSFALSPTRIDTTSLRMALEYLGAGVK